MQDTGYVIMPRSLLTALSPALRPMSAFLFIHLYGRANWQDAIWDDGTQAVTIKRGELVTSQIKLAEQTGMSRQEIRTALAALERNRFINQQVTKRYTLIRIDKYDEFARDILTGNESQPSLNPVPTTIEEGKKRVKAIADKIVDTVRLSQFNELWAKYPRPLGKKEAYKHFTASVQTPADWEDIQWALTCYVAQIKRDGTTMEFIQHGKTWFNNWRDWVQARPAPKAAPVQRPKEIIPEEPPMTPEEMEQIRRENMTKFVPPQEVQDLVTRLAGGAAMNPKEK